MTKKFPRQNLPVCLTGEKLQKDSVPPNPSFNFLPLTRSSKQEELKSHGFSQSGDSQAIGHFVFVSGHEKTVEIVIVILFSDRCGLKGRQNSKEL